MDSEIKTCFSLFQKCLEKTSMNVNEIRKYNSSKMTIEEISRALDVIYMEWLTSVYTVPKTSPIPIAFNHLKNMINNRSTCIENNYSTLNNEEDTELEDLPELIPNETVSETKKQLNDVQKVISSSSMKPLDDVLFKGVYVEEDSKKKEINDKVSKKGWW